MGKGSTPIQSQLGGGVVTQSNPDRGIPPSSPNGGGGGFSPSSPNRDTPPSQEGWGIPIGKDGGIKWKDGVPLPHIGKDGVPSPSGTWPGYPPPGPTRGEETDIPRNITFPRTSYAGGKKGSRAATKF